MPADPKNPKAGDLSIDATALSSFLVDLPPGAMARTRQEREGFREVLTEVAANQKTYGARAGIPDGDIQALQALTDRIADIERFLPAAEKLVELLTESKVKFDDDRHKIVSTIANTVDQRATLPGNGDLPALYRATREYRSAPAVRGARTRARNDAKDGDKDGDKGGDGSKPVPR